MLLFFLLHRSLTNICKVSYFVKNWVKSLQTFQFMSVCVGIDDGPFFNKVFWSSYNTVLDKLIAFLSGAFSIISLILSFFLALYYLCFSFLLSTARFFLKLLFLFCGTALCCIWSRSFLRLCRDFILRSTTTAATSYCFIS